MILYIDSDASYLSEPQAHSQTGERYYLRSLPCDPRKAPNLVPASNVPIHTECRILNHVVMSAAKAEVVGLFITGKKSVPLQIILRELGFPQPPTTTKTDNSASEGIFTTTVRQKKSKEMDMSFYRME